MVPWCRLPDEGEVGPAFIWSLLKHAAHCHAGAGSFSRSGERIQMSYVDGSRSSPATRYDHLIGVVIAGITVLALLFGVKWSFVLALDFSVVGTYAKPLVTGLLMTLGISFFSLFVGSIAGVLLAVAHRAGNRPVRWLIATHIEIWRDTPLLVQIFWIHFALPMLTGISTTIIVSGVVALTLQASAYLAEIIRAGIASVPKGQWEAAQSLGLHSNVVWRKIVLPQALRTMLPPLVNTAFSFFKGSTILSILGVTELLRMGTIISTYSHKPIEIMTAVGLIYLVIGIVFTLISNFVEKIFS
jgi:His/Glu/Gln/Arg/opine family amino acid ABC transporter permease subunit